MIDYTKFDVEFAQVLRDSLTKKQQKRLVRIIASIMERAYRRGVQQALVLNSNDSIDKHISNDLHKWRYDKSVSLSGGLDGFKSTSLERLEMEEPNIHLMNN